MRNTQPSRIRVGFVALAFVLGAAAIVYGSIGVPRSARYGGLGACIYATCVGGMTVLLSGAVLAFALVSLAAA